MRISALLATVLLLLVSLQPAEAGLLSWLRGKKPEEKIKEQMTRVFNEEKQSLFRSIHPVGTATEVKVHDVEIAWRNNTPSKNLNDMIGFGIVFTIYWSGPVTRDGYTKVYAVYDAEVGRFVGSRVLATNGVTSKQAATYAVDFLNRFLSD